MIKALKTLCKQSLVLYALFLIPTLLWFLYGGTNDSTLSQTITGTWQAHFWTFSGVSAKASRIIIDILELVAIGGLTWFFYQGFQVINQYQKLSPPEAQHLLKTITLWLVGAGVLLLLVVPFHSSDLYGYLNRGFQQSVFNTNPYLTPIAEISGWSQQPLLHAHWIYNPCPYGFFFALLTKWITMLSGPHFLSAFVLFKGLNLLTVIGCAGLIYKIAKDMGQQRPWLSLYLFAANPLVLLHAIGNGHNDILMVFLLLVAFYALQYRQWQWLSLSLLVLSVLTKYASILAAPFMLGCLIQNRRWKALSIGLTVAAALSITLALPYINPEQSWPWRAILDNAGKPQHSLIDMLTSLVYYVAKPFRTLLSSVFHLSSQWPSALRDQLLLVLKPLFWAGFAAFYLGLLGWRFLPRQVRQKFNPNASPKCSQREAEQAHSAAIASQDSAITLSQVISRSGLALTIMVSLISAKFHPWYTLMFLPVMLLESETSPWRRFALSFSLFQIAGFSILQNLPVFNVAFLTLLPAYLVFKNRDPFRPAQLVSSDKPKTSKTEP